MSLEQLLPGALPSQLEESKPVSPTLLIGLGGTGKEVLLRFRRLIVERYGSLDALPFLQYIHLDTDGTANAREQYDRKSGDDPLAEAVSFDPVERVDLTIDGGTGKYTEHLNAHPHLKRWFPASGKVAHLGNLGGGAGQIRLASRLGLYHAPNFARLKARLDQVRGRLQDPAILSRAAKLGFDFDSTGTTIYVVCSLAGGTGSGTFLDLGFLLQRFFPSAERVGILLLPSFFHDYAGGERVKANGYAALMELNHYSFGHKFLADWDGSNPEYLSPPPFTHTYLLDSTNEARFVIGSSGKEYDAYQMIAETLFQDYAISKFSGTKRAVRVNLVNFNLNVYTHNFLNEALRTGGQDHRKTVVGDTFPTRFGSFGLARISFPTDRLHSACAARLAGEVLEFWQSSVLENPLEKLFVEFLASPQVACAQGSYERRDGGGTIERADLEDELLVFDSGSGRTFPSYLWEKAQGLRSELEALPTGQKAARLASFRAEMEVLLAKEDSEDPNEWGVGVRQIEANFLAARERIKAAIRAKAEEFNRNPRYGVAYTLSLLRELKSLLRNENFRYQPYFEAQITTWRDEVQAQSFALDQLQLDLARHERQLLFRGEDVRRDLEKLVAESQDDPDQGVLYNFLVGRVLKQVAKRGLRLCQEIDGFLGADDATGTGLLGEYYALLAGFERLRHRLRVKERYFRRLEPSVLTISLYREDEDLDGWYRQWTGEADGRLELLRRFGNQLLLEVFQVDSVTAALAFIQNRSVQEIEDRLLAECKRFFGSQSRQPDALRLLFDGSRFTKKERDEMIQRAFNLSKVWLAPPQMGLDHVGLDPVRADQRPCLVGVDTSNEPLLNEFKAIVLGIQTPGDSPPAFHNLGEMNRGTVIFYQELAGVPAFYPASVTSPNGFCQAYLNFPDKDELHSDKNRFQFGDLIPKKPEEARRYAESLKAFVLGRLLGLLKVKERRDDTDQPTFHYSYRRETDLIVEEVQLGDELSAVDLLYRDVFRPEHQTDRRVLLEQVEKVISTLQRERKQWLYALLLEFYLRLVYPPSQDRDWFKGQDLTITQFSPQYAVLSQARAQIEQWVVGQEERSRFRQALEASRGKPLGEELTFDEYLKALGPWCHFSGKVVVRSVNVVGVERLEYRPVPALDLTKLPRTESTEAPATAASPAATRPCPGCSAPIDVRATFCIHCKKSIATVVPCGHCGEARVPSDLDNCWRCGSRMRAAEKTVCPTCFSWSGYEEEFPCPECGGLATVAAAGIAAVPAVPGEVVPVAKAGLTAPLISAPLSATAPAATGATIECPTCFYTVAPGPTCPICQGLLPAA